MLDEPILCTKNLYFEGNSEEKGFTCFEGGLAKKESPYPFDHLSVERLTISPHQQMTHAETECHIKQKDGLSIMKKVH